MKLSDRHYCNLDAYPCIGYGQAIELCEERGDRTLWVSNSEYGTQVNFCPACGFKAAVQVIDAPKGACK